MEYTATVSSILSILVMTTHASLAVCIVFLVVRWILGRQGKQSVLIEVVFGFVTRYALALGAIVALVAVSGSLFYSEVAKFTPCVLCWFQRIVVYPQLILLGLALIRRDRRIFPYVMTLAAIGIIIAAYHYGIQVSESLRNATESLQPCSVVGYTPTCSSHFVFQYGYITIPVMSLTASVLFMVVSLFGRRRERSAPTAPDA